MKDIEWLAGYLHGRTLTDIVVPGYIDTVDTVKRFHPMFDDIFFQFDGIILRASSIEQFWYLGLDLVDKIDYRFELEDDDEFGISSVDFVLARPTGPNIVRQLIAFTAQDESVGYDRVVCAALELDHGDVNSAPDIVFLNPRNEFGIHLGTHDALENWRQENSVASLPALERVFPAIHNKKE